MKVFLKIDKEGKHAMKFLGFPLYRIEKNKIFHSEKIRILGIPWYRRTINGTKKRIYIFEIPISSSRKTGYETEKRFLFFRKRKYDFNAEIRDRFNTIESYIFQSNCVSKEGFSKIYNQVHLRNNGLKLSFKTFSELTELIRNRISIIPDDIDLIIGVPRSGIIPAYLIALFLNKNACSINEFINHLIPQKGERPIINTNRDGLLNVLIVDDSIYSGNALSKTKEQLKNIDASKYSIKYCAIFAKEETKYLVDYYFEVVDPPRMFQWNYLNHSNASISCYDMDGVLCVDPTNEQNDDGEKYINFIKNAVPLYIPSYKINSIVTSRLEKYRKITEEWLDRNHVQYSNLYMLNLASAEKRRKLGCHADFKASIYREKEDCFYFIESNRNQAKKIAELTGKQVICVQTDEYFNG